MSVFLEKIVTALSGPTGLAEEEIRVLIETPRDPQHGEYAFPCFVLAKSLRKGPPAIAKDLAEKLAGSMDFTPSPTGAYLNFRIPSRRLAEEVLPLIRQQAEAYGRSEEGKGKTILLDYSHPNIAKPFGIGHLRSTVIGAALRNIFEALGYRTVSINHLGDWGTQFGKMIAAYRRWGDEEALKKDPIEYLYGLNTRFHREAKTDESLDVDGRERFRELEEGKEEALALWKRFRELSLEEFMRIYHRLGISFDSYAGESFYNKKAEEAVREVEEKGVAYEHEGALVVDLDGLPTCLIRKSDGTTLYLTRDLAAAEYRYETYEFDHLIYVVGAPQKLHFRQLFGLIRKLGYSWWDRCEHVEFGHILGMKTRDGTLIFLEEVLNEARDRALRTMRESVEKRFDLEDEESVAEAVGLGVVIFNDLSGRRIKDVHFDWDRLLSFDGDSGPYLQYAHARMEGILRKCGIEVPDRIDPGLLVEDEAATLLRLLERYPSVLQQAGRNREPSIICRFILDLARAVSVAYPVLRVKDEAAPLAEARLLLLWSVKQVLASGLRVIGMQPIERM
ncbi:MAG: arginine--tRNA ligase [Planctomycetota bacterium]|nr:arginine--tRNA ligase [Planctomycetota bacterium]